MSLQKRILKNCIFGFSAARTGLYLLESLPIIATQQLLVDGGFNKNPAPKKYKKETERQVIQLLKTDADNISAGYYPATVLTPSSPARHGKTYLKVLADSFKVALRKRSKKHDDFSQSLSNTREDLPEYYDRNFHFQTDGYLTEDSAEIYNHQVEVLFRGTADAMRRLVLKPIFQFFSSLQLKRPKVLELGAGDGSASRFMLESFPSMTLTCMDLSSAYLKKARQTLQSYPNVNFVTGDVSQTPFLNESFDAVTSVFLFHEMPLKIRKKTLEEAFRVLKPGGLLCIVDSIQWNDNPELNWGLEQFPIDFHEPFYTNYIKSPLDALVTDVGFVDPQVELGFYSKSVTAQKPLRLSV